MPKPVNEQRKRPIAQTQWQLIIGLFFGAAAGTTIAIVGLLYFVDRITIFVITLVAILLALAFVFCLVAYYKEWIFHRLFSGAQGSLAEITKASTSAARELSAGDVSTAVSHAESAIHEAVALYSWSRFRWLSMTWCLALVAAIAAYSNSMLVFKQNEIMEKQNKLVERQEKLIVQQNTIANLDLKNQKEQTEIAEAQRLTESLALRSQLRQSSEAILQQVNRQIRITAENRLSVLKTTLVQDRETIASIRFLDAEQWLLLSNDASYKPKPYSFFSDHRLLNQDEKRILQRLKWYRHLRSNDPQATLASGDLAQSEIDLLAGVEIKPWADSSGQVSHDVGRTRLPPWIYREISTKLENLSAAHTSESTIIREAKGTLLLSLLRSGIDLQPLAHGGGNFSGCEFRQSQIRLIKFKKLVLTGSVFEGVNFSSVTFDGCDLRQCKFKNCNFEDCSFEGSFLPIPKCFVSCTIDYFARLVDAYVPSIDWGDLVFANQTSNEYRLRETRTASLDSSMTQRFRFMGRLALSNPLARSTTDPLAASGIKVNVKKIANKGYRYAKTLEPSISGIPQSRLHPDTVGHNFIVSLDEQLLASAVLKLNAKQVFDYGDHMLLFFSQSDVLREGALVGVSDAKVGQSMNAETVKTKVVPKAMIRFTSPTGIEVDWNGREADDILKRFLSRLSPTNLVELEINNVIPGSFSLEDYKKLKERLEGVSVVFRLPAMEIVWKTPDVESEKTLKINTRPKEN